MTFTELPVLGKTQVGPQLHKGQCDHPSVPVIHQIVIEVLQPSVTLVP